MPLTQEQHRELAAALFNHVWNRMEQTQRTVEETDDMIAAAHASLYHWMQCGTALNSVRGHWQISRMYARLGAGNESLHHARRCLDVCLAHGINDFDLAYAYEAMARANSLLGDDSAAREHATLMVQAAAAIAKPEDATWFAKDAADMAQLLVN